MDGGKEKKGGVREEGIDACMKSGKLGELEGGREGREGRCREGREVKGEQVRTNCYNKNESIFSAPFCVLLAGISNV